MTPGRAAHWPRPRFGPAPLPALRRTRPIHAGRADGPAGSALAPADPPPCLPDNPVAGPLPCVSFLRDRKAQSVCDTCPADRSIPGRAVVAGPAIAVAGPLLVRAWPAPVFRAPCAGRTAPAP